MVLKKNLKKYDVVIGMYHDQVALKLFNFNAINITISFRKQNLQITALTRQCLEKYQIHLRFFMQ